MYFNWPLLELKKTNTEWWTAVDRGTQTYKNFFRYDLSEDSLFTIKVIVYVLTTRTRDRIEFFFDGTTQKNRLLRDFDRIATHPESKTQTVKELIKDFYDDYLFYLKQLS